MYFFTLFGLYKLIQISAIRNRERLPWIRSQWRPPRLGNMTLYLEYFVKIDIIKDISQWRNSDRTNGRLPARDEDSSDRIQGWFIFRSSVCPFSLRFSVVIKFQGFCPKCGERLATDGELAKHIQNIHGLFVCAPCGITFKKKFNLERHQSKKSCL